MDLIIKRVRYGTGHYRKVKKLYLRAFPRIERLPLWLLSLEALTPGIEFYAIYDGEEFCGLFYLTSYRNSTLLFYFAVRDDLRGKGYGGEALKWLRGRGKPVSLIMESMREQCDNAAQRQRRSEFYQRNGFRDTGHYMKSGAGLFDILSTEGKIDPSVAEKQLRRVLFWTRDLEIGRF